MTKSNNINRLHIGLFGRRNTGKSSVLNCLTGQQLAIVSDIPGTTTDPVKKAVEIPALGPVVLIDTAGIDDTGELGGQRVSKTQQAMKQVDIAIVVCCHNVIDREEHRLIATLQQLKIPMIILHNKADEQPAKDEVINEITSRYQVDFLDFSAKTGQNADGLLQLIQQNIPDGFNQRPSLFGDKIQAGDMVLFVTPIDSEAPEGRLILPQVQAIREALDHHCTAVILKESEVKNFMDLTSIIPNLVITDSQLFGKIDKIISPDIPLTSFSILLARQKGDFEAYLKGTPFIDKLQNGDRILMLESCTHHSTCDDIGRVKIPRWLQEYTGRQLEFDVVPGLAEPPRPIHEYALVVQCGGCMITRKQLLNRLQPAINANIPVTNYGMAIAYVKGSWKRSVELFHDDLQEQSHKN